jgi:hypothetical protein
MIGFSSLLAQTPIIVDFRKIIADGPNQFNNLNKGFMEEDAAGGIKYYYSNLTDSPISQSYIQQNEKQTPMYVLDYNVTTMDSMMLGLFTNMVGQYMAEMNAMINSGMYKASEYDDGGRSVTEIKNLNDDLVVQYVSDLDRHTIFFFTTAN